MSGFSLTVPNQDNGNITRRLSTNIRPQSTQIAKLDDLIRNVGQHWKELVSENANTLEAALALMDTSSIGKARYRSRFESLQNDLSSALKYHVDANYQGFNSSIGAYRSVFHSITDSQKNITDARDELSRAREGLATRRPTLKDLRASSLKYSAMIDILDKIEELKTVPDKLEAQISQKLFLSANETLSHALRLAESKELEGISALQPIKSYLLSQQSSLFSILIEELHNHVYLKSPYCDSRWGSYTQENDSFSNVEQMLEDKIKFDLAEKSTSTTFSGSQQLDDFLTRFNQDEPLVEDPKKNMESDSFDYIRLIVETFANLSRLSSAFDVIHQRLPTELHKIVDKTISEVSMRYPQNIRELQDSRNGFLDSGLMNNDVRVAVLKDLTWTLYSKLIAVLQGHRVIYEVVEGIAKGRSGTENAFNYDFNGVFKIVQSEIRSLLHSYITDKSQSTAQSKAMHDMLRVPQGSKKTVRDKSKPLFKFEQVDYYQSAEFQQEYQGLQDTLEYSVPGLLTNAYSDKENSQITPYAPTDLSSAHRLLVAPNVLNIRVMLDPTVMFLQKTKALFPYRSNAESKESDTFIEDFLVNVFLPQLEDSLSLSFHKIMSSPETMQVDLQWSKLSKRPIFKGASSFVELVKRTCRLLNTGYMYREKYAILVVTMIQWVYKFFLEQYEGIVAQDEAQSQKPKRMAALLAQEPEMRKACITALENPLSVDDETSIKEAKALLAKRKPHHGDTANNSSDDGGLVRSDLLDISSYKTLATMATSLRWIVLKLKALRRVASSEEADQGTSLDTKMKKRWTLMEVNRAAQVDSSERDTAKLILQGAQVSQFDQNVAKLEGLAQTCLVALRCDVRVRVVYFVDKSMTEGDYFSEIDSEERDGQIGELDSELIKSDDMVVSNLLQPDKQYLLLGLSRFINEVLVLAADRLNYLNANGVKKMHCNILALQQTLKSIVHDPQQVDFKRAIEFYDSFTSNPAKFLEGVKSKDKKKKQKLNYEESKILLRLMHNEAIRKFEMSNRRDAANQARSVMKDHMHELHQHFWSGNV